MTIVLDGTNGITNDGGYTGDGVVFADTTPANTLVTTTGGNVGIGTSSPVFKLDLASASGLMANFLETASGSTRRIRLSNSGAVNTIESTAGIGATNLALTVDGVECARIDSARNFLLGTTSAISGTQMLQVVNSGGDSTQLRVRCSGAAAGRHWRYGTDSGNTLYIINQDSTGVYMSNGNTGWTGLSDKRHKDIIEPISNASEKVSTLRAVIGKYKTDDEGTRRSFLIAQDVQEQQALITALTARVVALEGTQP